MADCDSVRLLRVKPAAKEDGERASRRLGEPILGGGSEGELHGELEDGDRNAKAFPRAHICASKG